MDTKERQISDPTKEDNKKLKDFIDKSMTKVTHTLNSINRKA